MQKITPFLCFNGQAEEAARFYTSALENSRITNVTHYLEGSLGEPGAVMTVEFELAGQKFVALNADLGEPFSAAISFSVACESQQELDGLWDRLGEGGEEIQCGWLTDRFGLAWQITPRILPEMLEDKDRAKAQRAFTAMLGMVKLDIAELRRAFEG